jgi:hypothetical protein
LKFSILIDCAILNISAAQPAAEALFESYT